MTLNDILTVSAIATALATIIKQQYDKRSQTINDNLRIAETVERVYGSMIHEMKSKIDSLEAKVKELERDREEGNRVLEIIYKFNCGAHCKILKAVKAFKDGKDTF